MSEVSDGAIYLISDTCRISDHLVVVYGITAVHYQIIHDITI